MIWRLLLDEPAPAAWNMAVDEALLLSNAPGDAPVLRFYGWNPPAVSLGRFQKAAHIPRTNALVRRPTGGRAIWHQHEITYAVVLREELLPREARSIIGSYQWLSCAFIAGLQSLGVEAQLASGENRQVVERASGHKMASRVENCFASAARSDFVVEGRKLIGAAQCRTGGAILQHGSLLLDVEEAAWRGAVGGSMADTVSLHQLGIDVARPDVIAALCAGVRAILGADLQESQLTPGERVLAQQLEWEKYNCDVWNLQTNAN